MTRDGDTEGTPKGDGGRALSVGDAVCFTHKGETVHGHLLQRQGRRRRAKVIDTGERTWMVPEAALSASGRPRRASAGAPGATARASWRVGDEVVFDGPNGRSCGRIVRLGPARARVRSDGSDWNVPYALLHPAGERGARDGTERPPAAADGAPPGDMARDGDGGDTPRGDGRRALSVGDAVCFTNRGETVHGHLLQRQGRRRHARVIDAEERTWQVPEAALSASGRPRLATIVTSRDTARASWRVGDEVVFDGPDGRSRGKIVRLGSARARVRGDGSDWGVPYALLRPAGERGARNGAERLRKVTARARELMDLHGLADWTFAFLESTRRLGDCNYRDRVIRVGRSHALDGKDPDVEDTILHEIAHGIAGKDAGHGPAWKAVARRIGATPKARVHEHELA